MEGGAVAGWGWQGREAQGAVGASMAAALQCSSPRPRLGSQPAGSAPRPSPSPAAPRPASLLSLSACRTERPGQRGRTDQVSAHSANRGLRPGGRTAPSPSKPRQAPPGPSTQLRWRPRPAVLSSTIKDYLWRPCEFVPVLPH